MPYPWYVAIENSIELQQGDFINQCPIVIPPAIINEGEELEVDIKLIDSIILSQSCDLANEKIDIVLVCPYMELQKFLDELPLEQVSSRASRLKTIDNLRKGFLPGFHLLNKYEGFFEDYLVVDFRNVYGIHITYLREIGASATSRHRLLPPYREHLSQAFARYFMRVGLPQDIFIDGY